MSDRLSADLAALQIPRDQGPRPSGRALRTAGALLALTGAGLGIYAYTRPRLEARLFKTEVGVTEIVRHSPAQASLELTATGYVVPDRVARVGSDVAGRITAVAVREGERVRQGQTLFELDTLDQKSSLASARARAAAAVARAAAAAAAADEIKQQWQRNRALVAEGAVAKSTGDDLEARLRAMQAAARAASVEAAAVTTEVHAQSSNLRHFRILAPIDGRVVGKPAELGEVARPDALSPLLQLVDFDSLLVEVDVPEARLGLVKIGGPVEIVLDAYPDRRRRGSVAEITPRVNRSKATVVVKAKFEEETEGVLPEMAARVGFLSKPLDEAALRQAPKQVVPAAAVAERGGRKVVFVVDNGHARETPVTLGPAVGDGNELLAGPAPGARLVRNPPATMADGHPIKERKPE